MNHQESFTLILQFFSSRSHWLCHGTAWKFLNLQLHWMTRKGNDLFQWRLLLDVMDIEMSIEWTRCDYLVPLPMTARETRAGSFILTKFTRHELLPNKLSNSNIPLHNSIIAIAGEALKRMDYQNFCSKREEILRCGQ